MSRLFVEIDAPQRSELWLAARVGRLTGSCAHDAFAKTKSGWSTSRRNLLLRLCLERLMGRPMEQNFVTPAMLTGIEREPLALAAFESLTGEVVQTSGFLAHVEHWAGCSLDGHLGDYEALVSIKCRQPAAHLDFLRSGVIPADALTQIQHELWVTGAQTHHYFGWNPDFPPALQSRLVTVQREDLEIPRYEAMALTFLEEVAREDEALATMANPMAQMLRVVA